MAYDELLADNVGAFKGWVVGTWQRWAAAAMSVRSDAYQRSDFWRDLKAQVRDNWDTWDELANFSGYPTTPTVVIRGAHGHVVGVPGVAFVHRHLDTGAPSCTAAEEFGGAGVIPAGDFSLQTGGDLKGKLVVTLINEPAVGTYRGMVLHKRPADPQALPIAWVVVHVE
jgi:hypothetical protein